MTDPIISGEAPHSEIVAHITTIVAKRYPHGGNQLCAAINLAIDLAWTARHEFAQLQGGAS